MHVFDFTVHSKNLSFTHRLSGYFLDVLWNQRLVLYSRFYRQIWVKVLVVLVCFLITKPVFANEFLIVPVVLTQEQQKQLALKIEQRETAGKDNNLTYWSKNEDFPSFGIGHFIWLPNNQNFTFKETFPELVSFLKKKSRPPSWLTDLSPFELPWQTRQEFYDDFNKPKLLQLRNWLKKTKSLQTEFIYQRFLRNLNAAQKKLSNKQRQKINGHLKKLISTPQGFFALIDYASFKGVGNNDTEIYRYNGKTVGWGLIDVLLNMPKKTENSLNGFIHSAKVVLKRRTDYASKDNTKQNEKKWLKGWYYRLDSYTKY